MHACMCACMSLHMYYYSFIIIVEFEKETLRGNVPGSHKINVLFYFNVFIYLTFGAFRLGLWVGVEVLSELCSLQANKARFVVDRL